MTAQKPSTSIRASTTGSGPERDQQDMDTDH